MDTPQICTYTKDEMRCERLAAAGTDRCDKHPHDGGSAANPQSTPPSKPPSTAFDKIKNLLAIERLIELGEKALEWIEQHIPPDIFGEADRAQLELLKQIVGESDPARKRQLASQLASSLNPAQLLVLVGLAVAASAALKAASSGANDDA